MKPENLIIVAGMLTALGVVLGATFMGDSTSLDAPMEVVNAPQQAVASPQAASPSMVQVAAAPTQKAQQGLVPFEAAPLLRYRGQVDRIFVRGAGTDWSQEHIWVTSGAGTQEISLAPRWYLEHLGCPVNAGDSVHGVAFNFNNMQPEDTFLYAKKVVLNGTACLLRNDEGLALWSNRLVTP